MTYRRSEIVVIRSGQARAVVDRCPRCAMTVEMLSIDSSVDLSGCGTRQLFEILEVGLVHSIESASGHLLVCRRSLEDLLHGENI